MQRIPRILSILAALVMLIPAVAVAQQPAPAAETMTIWQARRTILALGWPAEKSFHSDLSNFRFTTGTFEFDGPNRTRWGGLVKGGGMVHYTVDLKNLEAVAAKCYRPIMGGPGSEQNCTLGNGAGKSLEKSGKEFAWFQNFGWSDPYNGKGASTCLGDCQSAANTFAAAINRLRALANDPNFPLRTFIRQAAAWRTLSTKPPIPEAARVQRLLAEEAVKANQPEEALNRYDAGIEIYPTWPEGNFNAALVASQLGYYAEAADHMQAYLELVPDASDAQSARDQVAIWQYKADHPAPQGQPPTEPRTH